MKGDGPTRDDWICAGLKALAESGVDGVRIERLAATLGISKGPFYWRFKDRGELLAAMIDYWQRNFTDRLIEQGTLLNTPQERMEALVVQILSKTAGPVDVSQTEGALRAWAAQDRAIGTVVQRVDAQRIGYLAQELSLMGAAPEIAETMARAIYLALLGLYTARRYTPEVADDAAFQALVDKAMSAAQSGQS